MRSVRLMLTGIFLMLCAVCSLQIGAAVLFYVLVIPAPVCFIAGFCFADIPSTSKSGSEPDPGYTGMPDPDLPHCPYCNKQHAPELETCPYCGTKLN